MIYQKTVERFEWVLFSTLYEFLNIFLMGLENLFKKFVL